MMRQGWTRGVRWLLVTALAAVASIVFLVSPAVADPGHVEGRADFVYDALFDDGHSRDSHEAAGIALTASEEKAATAAEKPSGNVYDSTLDLVAPSATHLDEAASAANGVRLNAQLAADEIAGGHAYVRHVVERGEFPGIQTRAQFADMIEAVITDYSDIAPLSGGRTAYWRDGVVVIRNPSSVDGGTAFVPTDGYAYFETIN